jgi:hypothetical protein
MARRLFRHNLKYFTSSLSIALGLVLISRGIWYAMDFIDTFLFGGNHFLAALLWIIAGVLILYLPDRDLDELRKL